MLLQEVLWMQFVPDQFKRLSTNRMLFAEWVFEDEELSEEELILPVEEQEARTAKLVKGSESAEQFEKLLWFELGKFIWKDHHQVYYEHIEYLQQNIVKPFKWTMVQYISRIREIENVRLLHLPSAPFVERPGLLGSQMG